MRLFVAVNLPAEERRAVHAALEPLRAAGLPLKHSAAEGLHITLKFLGAVEPERSAAIGASLAGAVRSVKSFDLAIGGFGTFPDAGSPRVVWLGVERHPALELLANDVERAMAAHGFESELRPFAPHVTVARAKKDAARGALKGVADVLESLSYESVIPVASVDLMESTPGRNGSVYRVAHAARLVAGG